MPNKAAIVAYRGPSQLDGAPIRAVVTFDSRNTKTGPMAQLWILHDTVAPHDAQKSGDDAAVCGACPMRPSLARSQGLRHRCYVKTYRAPLATWRATSGRAADLGAAVASVSGLLLRLGAYGDPAALPREVVEALASVAAGHTGYTHSPSVAPWLSAWVMASAETTLDALRLQRQGWRTFRQSVDGVPGRQLREVTCPATTRGVQCQTCLLCDGSRGPQERRKSVVIANHA